MSSVFAKHTVKLTVTLLILAAIGASAFIESIHSENLRKDAAALRTITARQGAAGWDDLHLPDRARTWLAEARADIEARHAAARLSIEHFLEGIGMLGDDIVRSKSGSDDRGPVWRLIRVNDRLNSPSSVLGLGVPRKTLPGSMSETLDRFLTNHTPVSYEVLVGVQLPDSNRDGGPLEPGERIVSVALAGPTDVQIIVKLSNVVNIANQAMPQPTVMRLKAEHITVAGPSPAELILGRDPEAVELWVDKARIRRLDRLYGGLNLDEAKEIISRAIASRYDAVSLLGIEFPAEYFAIALSFACAAVLLGIVVTLRLAVARLATPLAFEDTESLAALLLARPWGRTLLWLVLPLLAIIGARPDSWLAGWGIWAFLGGLVLSSALGITAVWLGSLATRSTT